MKEASSFDYLPDWKHAKSQKLMASDGYHYDNFGTSVSIHENTIVVGAVSHLRQGSVHVFDRSEESYNGLFVQNPFPLTGMITESNDFYGWSVDIYGNNIAVGAYLTDTRKYSTASYGMVYMYSRVGDMISNEWRVCFLNYKCYHFF